MMNEQERLARLIEQESREPIDSASMIEGFLKEQLGAPSQERMEKTMQEIEASGDVIENSSKRLTKTSSSKSINRQISLPAEYSTEKMLLSLYDLREDLIGAFESTGINTRISETLTTSIKRAEKCIKDIGGDVEDFIPINHVSGLQTPNFHKNAEKVIETTLQCYTLGKIEEAKIKDNGKTINIIFSNTNDNTAYRASGTIKADEWTGNEAIDYIYTSKGGKMSVKSYENGRWIDRSSSKKYQVHWELEETEINNKKEVEAENNVEEQVEIGKEKIEEIKEGKENLNWNKLSKIKKGNDNPDEEI